MIQALLWDWAQATRRVFDHGRLGTVGSSEVGHCLRQVGFSKWEQVPDPEHEESLGFAIRGTVMEDHYWVPAIRAGLPPGAQLLYAGEEQETLASGYLSATPDGVITGLPREALNSLGVIDIGPSGCIGVECKSIDPRANKLLKPRPEHEFQVQVALGLIRYCRPEQPDYAVISYINASNWAEVTEFAIRYDPAMYEAARARALAIMSAWDEDPAKPEGIFDPQRLPPEGKLAGGKECKYCAWSRQCVDATIASIPPTTRASLDPDVEKELKSLRDYERDLASLIGDNEAARAQAQEAIKTVLRQAGVRSHKADGWSVTWSTIKGRISIDQKALEASGVDLEPFKKEGGPSERLTVT